MHQTTRMSRRASHVIDDHTIAIQAGCRTKRGISGLHDHGRFCPSTCWKERDMQDQSDFFRSACGYRSLSSWLILGRRTGRSRLTRNEDYFAGTLRTLTPSYSRLSEDDNAKALQLRVRRARTWRSSHRRMQRAFDRRRKLTPAMHDEHI